METGGASRGRLIFDIYSLDHLSFARQAEVTVDELMAQGASAFNMHLSAERLCLAANEIGLKVLGTVPYGDLFSGNIIIPPSLCLYSKRIGGAVNCPGWRQTRTCLKCPCFWAGVVWLLKRDYYRSFHGGAGKQRGCGDQSTVA